MPEVRLIDANALLKSEIERCKCVPLVCTTDLNGIACDGDSLKSVLDRQPTIESEPVRSGRWIYRSDDAASCYCSECNEEALTAPYERNCIESDFCPSCGARMGADEIAERRAAADDYAEY